MSTVRQQKLAKAIVVNTKAKIPKNKGELLESVGYAQTTATRKPGEILNQKGVKDELRVLGFDSHSAKRVVSEIMLSKKTDANTRLKATDQVFKVEGSYAPEKTTALNLNFEARNMANPELEAVRQRFIEELKDKIK